MNVCLLNDSFPPVIDGVANVVMNYARIMQTEGLADVCVATPRYPNTDYSVYPYRVIPYQSFDTTKIVKGYRAGNPFDLRELMDLTDFKPDIIHSHCPVASTYVARMLHATTDAPLIFTYHTKFDEDIARAVKAEILQKEAVKVLVNNIQNCDEIWVVSNGAGENLKSLGYEGDYRVVSNGVDFAKGRVSAEEVAAATAGYDLPEGVPVFLFVGRIISYKGIPIILDACKTLAENGMDFRCIFVGSGPDADAMKEKAAEYGLLDRKVFFTGPIYDRNVLRAWNTRADLFLFPSTYDTNGIVVREAAACGLASVLIEGSCAAEGITDDRNGFLTQQTAEAMSELLLRICKDLDHVRQVGRNAMDEIYISWEDSVHAAHERYGEILDLKHSGKLIKRQIVADYFQGIVNMPEDIIRETQEIWNKSSRNFDNMMGNVENFSNQMQNEMQDVFRELFTNVHDIKEEIKEEIKRGFH